MRLCLMIEGQEDVTWPQWEALADACERSGLEGLHRSDHYLSVVGRAGRGSLDALTTLAGLAERTSRIRLGTMVSPATFRHPSVTANAATTIDHISGGRAELGLGAGWHEREHEAFGFPFPPMGARMKAFEEQAEVIVRQWTEGPFTFEGDHYRLVDCDAHPKPVQRPHPPLIIGGSGKPRTVAVAARLGQEYNVTYATVDECRALRDRLDQACEQAGRDPSAVVLSVMTTCVIAEREADVVRLAQRVADRGFGEPGQDGAALLAENRDTWVCGTVDQAAERLGELAEAGVERMMLQHLLHDDLESVELMGGALAAAVA